MISPNIFQTLEHVLLWIPYVCGEVSCNEQEAARAFSVLPRLPQECARPVKSPHIVHRKSVFVKLDSLQFLKLIEFQLPRSCQISDWRYHRSQCANRATKKPDAVTDQEMAPIVCFKTLRKYSHFWFQMQSCRKNSCNHQFFCLPLCTQLPPGRYVALRILIVN